MPVKPGQIINPAGRPKGAPNKTTEQIKSFFALILEKQEDKFLDALNRLFVNDPKAYIDVLTKLSNKFVPDVQRTELTGEGGETLTPIQIILPANPNQDHQRLDLSDEDREDIFKIGEK